MIDRVYSIPLASNMTTRRYLSAFWRQAFLYPSSSWSRRDGYCGSKAEILVWLVRISVAESSRTGWTWKDVRCRDGGDAREKRDAKKDGDERASTTTCQAKLGHLQRMNKAFLRASGETHQPLEDHY